ncbi:MAG: DUF2786 domain-containing protein [Desulfobacterales bacterium]|nr:DUF2786 domain-containing protein [Desulfobacterales bacterium]MBF0396597.1 DUF2786 domain-containing protein [Desulfobacterales bacterium]
MVIINKRNIHETLEHRILHGLMCEWKKAIDLIDQKYSNLMRMPIFSLKDIGKKLGYWSSSKREICLNRDFVVNYPWEDVIEVLLHEMAHQMTEEVCFKINESDHGETFRYACKILHANPKASGDYKPIHDRIKDDDLSYNDKILIRVKKLMALAESQNIHEAEAAMAKSHELILKHNLELFETTSEKNFVNVFLGKPELRRFREDYSLANILQDFYFVYCIWVNAYSIEKCKMGKILEINGTIQNVKIANYVYDFVRRYIDSKWEKYNLKKRFNRYRKTDFAVGIIKGFNEKLLSQQDKCQLNPKTSLELIKTHDPMFTSYINYRYPRTKTINHKSINCDEKVMAAGIKEGKNLVISKGITDKGKTQTFMIE